MKNFIKNNGQWIRVAVILAAVIFAAGRITNSHAELCRKVELKVDRQIYDLEIAYQHQELRRIQHQLDRIEKKINGLIIDRKH